MDSMSSDFDFSSNEEIFNALMERIFGSDIRQKTSSSYQIDGRYSINLNQTNKDGKVQSNNAYLFNKTIQDACKIDIFEVFSDNFLSSSKNLKKNFNCLSIYFPYLYIKNNSFT